VTVLPLLREWFARKFEIVEYGELWASTADHPANDWLRSHGREPGDPEFFITRQVILNVLHAAGGIEYVVSKIDLILDAEEKYVDAVVPELRFDDRPTTVVGAHRDELQFEFVSLLLWLKMLQERIKDPPKGLIPMLAPDEPWTARIKAAYADLRDVAFEDRELANFATHSGAVTQIFGGAEMKDSRLVFPIPDRPLGRVDLWDQFTYVEGRDVRSYATNVLRAVSAFMDGMLSALESSADEEFEENVIDLSRYLPHQPETRGRARRRADADRARLPRALLGSPCEGRCPNSEVNKGKRGDHRTRHGALTSNCRKSYKSDGPTSRQQPLRCSRWYFPNNYPQKLDSLLP
jgi:hypothetical protein